jgi:acyl-CoA thioester hydrolase
VPAFERTFVAGWADMDYNGHMRNTSFLDRAADVRTMFLASHGFTIEELYRLRIGPVVMEDRVEYFREARLLDSLQVNYLCAGLADDGSRFRVLNEFRRADGQLAARVQSTGGWLNLDLRKLVAPPPTLLGIIQSLVRTPDFETLATSVRP